MSQTVQLTDVEREWANAFLKLMGVKSEFQAPEVKGEFDFSNETKSSPRSPPKQGGFLSGLKGKLTPKKKAPRFDEVGEKVLNKQLEPLALEETRLLVAKKSFQQLAGGLEDVGRKVEMTRPSAANAKIKETVLLNDTNVGVKGYRKRVVTPINTVLANAEKLADEGMLLEKLEELESILMRERVGYNKRLKGEENEHKKQQREKKVIAIDGRLAALKEIKTSLIENKGLDPQTRLERLEMMTPEDRNKIIENNPKLRQALFEKALTEKVDAKHVGALISCMSAKDMAPAIENLIKAKSDDPAFFGELCGECFKNEPPEELKTFYRENGSPFKHMSKAFVETSEDGKQYLDDVKDRAKKFEEPDGIPPGTDAGVLENIQKLDVKNNDGTDLTQFAAMLKAQVARLKTSKADLQDAPKRISDLEAVLLKISEGNEIDSNDRKILKEGVLLEDADTRDDRKKYVCSQGAMDSVTTAVESIIADVLGDAAPDSMAEMAAYYLEAKRTALINAQVEVTDAALAIGVSSFVMLRLVAPALIGSDVGVAASTVLQAIANNMVCKKPFDVFNDFIGTKIDDVNGRVLAIAKRSAEILKKKTK